MLFVLFAAVGLGWEANRTRRQTRAVARIQAAGGQWSYDSRLRSPAWLRRVIGGAYFLEVTEVFFRNRTTDDQVHWVVWNIPESITGLPEGVPKGSQLADGSYQISVTGTMYRGTGAAATGPLNHYVFELSALDTKLDVKPSSDAFETRANVIKAIQGHILAKAVYGGLFRRPQ